LIVAVDDAGRAAGFAHAGFGPNENGTGLSTAAGVVAMVAVAPPHQRHGVGSELLRRCEDYLRGRGARELYAGSSAMRNPFYQGLYGGSESPGVLASDAAAAAFFARHGYRPGAAYPVLQRHLAGAGNVVDGRFPALRRRFELRVAPRRGSCGWWGEAVLGPLELIDFHLEEKVTGQEVARASLWDMEGYSRCWNEPALGLVEVEVRTDLRRQAVAKFLLAQLFRYVQDQYFSLIEVQVRENDETSLRLFRSVGFAQVDTARAYRKEG
jgi:ribosomal protein S18 acetylase RimI-like enzyme